MSARHMVLIPVEGEIHQVDTPSWREMADAIGSNYVERVRVATAWSLAVDEEGRLTGKPVNPRASLLYGTHEHGQPIVGDVLLGREGWTLAGDDWLDTDLALATQFLQTKGISA